MDGGCRVQSWAVFVECNMQSPNNYLQLFPPCVSLSVIHGVEVVPPRLCGILGKDVTFDALYTCTTAVLTCLFVLSCAA